MTRFLLSRRAVLRGAGVAMALPTLEAMAAAGEPPRRFVALFTPNGSLHDKWRPVGTETDFTMSPMMSPLEPHKSRLCILEGLTLKYGGGEAHTAALGAALTGRPSADRGGTPGFATGISVDQVIAGQIGMTTPLKSLELAVQPMRATPWTRFAFAGPEQPLPPYDDQVRVFTRLFGDSADAGRDGDIRVRRQTVVDAVKDSHLALARRLGRTDRRKLDAHLAAVNDIQRRMSMGSSRAPGPACQRPDRPAAGEDFPVRARLQMDLMIMALACDLTRVVTFMYAQAASNVRPTWLGFEDEWHKSVHDGKVALVEAVWKWSAGEVAYLLGRLEAIREGDRSLLDSVLIFWTSEQSNGARHTHDHMPFMLAGGAGGALKTGRYLSYEGAPAHNNLLISILNLMGLPARTFGNPEWCSGPLPRLV